MGSRVINNPEVIKYASDVVKEFGSNALKEAAVNYDNVLLKSDGLDVVVGSLLGPLGPVGKIAAEAIGATHDFTLEKGLQYSYADGKKEGASAGIDFLFGVLKVAGGKVIESGKPPSPALENLVNAFEMTIDQTQKGVSGIQPTNEQK